MEEVIRMLNEESRRKIRELKIDELVDILDDQGGPGMTCLIWMRLIPMKREEQTISFSGKSTCFYPPAPLCLLKKKFRSRAMTSF